MPTSRKRVLTALFPQQPDCTPGDMLAVLEIGNKQLTLCEMKTCGDVRQLKPALVQTQGQSGVNPYAVAPPAS
ncbi:MAG: hypothetical protein WCG34_10675 [Leptolinea sp.]